MQHEPESEILCVCAQRGFIFPSSVAFFVLLFLLLFFIQTIADNSAYVKQLNDTPQQGEADKNGWEIS